MEPLSGISNEEYHIFYMVGVGKHIYRTGFYGSVPAICHQQSQIASLCGWIATDINYLLGRSKEDGIDHTLVHAGSGRIRNDDIRTSMLFDEVIGQDVFHISCIEEGIFDPVQTAVRTGILYGFGHVFDTDYPTGLSGYEIGDRPCTGIEVVNQFVPCETGKIARYPIELVGLPAIGLVERFSPDLELQSFHLLLNVFPAMVQVHFPVAYRVVALGIDHVEEV